MKVFISRSIHATPDEIVGIRNALKKDGHKVLDPHVLPDGLTLSETMGIDVAMLQAADAIQLLPKWNEHHVSITLHDIALSLGKKILEPSRERYEMPHQHKMRTIKKMKDLRKKKATYREIADELNREGVPTFSGNGKWHPQTIARFFTK